MANQEQDGRRLQQKLFYATLAGSLIICVLVAATAIVPLYKNLVEQELTSLEFSYSVQSARVEQYFETLRGLADQITSRTRIRQVLEQYNAGEATLAELRSFTAPKLQDAMAHSAAVEGISRFDKNGRKVVAVGLDLPVREQSATTEPLATSSLSGPVMSGNDSYLIVKAPIINRTKAVVGADRVVFNLNGLQAIAAEFAASNETRRMLLAYQQGEDYSLFPLAAGHPAGDGLAGKPVTGQLLTTIRAGKRGITTITGQIFGFENPVIAHGTVNQVPSYPLLIAANPDNIYRNVSSTVLKVAGTILVLIFLAGVGLWYGLKPLKDRVLVYQAELREEIQTLQDFLPICMYCKKVRDESGYWGRIESYIAQLADVEFSHGICEDCMQERFPEAMQKQNQPPG